MVRQHEGAEMPLTEQEQRVLDELERSLTRDDRRLAQKLSGHGRRPSYGRVVAMGAGVVVGILILVLGVIQETAWIGAVGFLLMFAVLVAGIADRRGSKLDAPVSKPELQKPKLYNQLDVGPSPTNRSAFMERLEDRWDRRQSENRQ